MEIHSRNIGVNFSIPAWLVQALDKIAKEQDATRSALAKRWFINRLNEEGYGHLIPPQNQDKPLPPAA